MRAAALSALIGCILTGCILAPASVRAGDDAYQREIKGPVAASVVKVRDGDTVEVEAYVWPMQSVHVAVRLRGIDAPEKRGKCDSEKAAAARATARLKQLLGTNDVYLSEISGDKYFGRVLAKLSVKGNDDLAKTLLKEGLVAPYQGGKRRDWCEQASLGGSDARDAVTIAGR